MHIIQFSCNNQSTEIHIPKKWSDVDETKMKELAICGLLKETGKIAALLIFIPASILKQCTPYELVQLQATLSDLYSSPAPVVIKKIHGTKTMGKRLKNATIEEYAILSTLASRVQSEKDLTAFSKKMTRSKLKRTLTQKEKLLLFAHFQYAHFQIKKEFKKIFTGGAPHPLGWAGTILDIAESQIFGKLKQTKKTKITPILFHLLNQHLKQQK